MTHMTASLSRSPLQHWQYSRHDITRLHNLCTCCQFGCGCQFIHFWLNQYPNLQFICSVLLATFTEVVGHVSQTLLSEFVNSNLLLRKSVRVVLYRCGDCTHPPSGFISFAQLAQRCICNNFLVILALFIAGTSKITQTIFNSIPHLLKWFFWRSGCQFYIFTISDIFLLLLNPSLCVVNFLSSHSGFAVHIIINPLVFLFIAQNMCIMCFLNRMSLFGLQPAPFPKGWIHSATKPLLPQFTW